MHNLVTRGQKVSNVNRKSEKKFNPGTLFEQGPLDPKSNALPTELLRARRFRPKIIHIYTPECR